MGSSSSLRTSSLKCKLSLADRRGHEPRGMASGGAYHHEDKDKSYLDAAMSSDDEATMKPQ